MRDVRRINEVLTTIAELWAKYPDWRLTQLIINATGAEGPALFYLEDDMLVERLKNFQ